MYIFFDTETNGSMEKGFRSLIIKINLRLVSMAFQVCDDERKNYSSDGYSSRIEPKSRDDT